MPIFQEQGNRCFPPPQPTTGGPPTVVVLKTEQSYFHILKTNKHSVKQFGMVRSILKTTTTKSNKIMFGFLRTTG